MSQLFLCLWYWLVKTETTYREREDFFVRWWSSLSSPPLSGMDGFFVLLHLSYCFHTPVGRDAPLNGLNTPRTRLCVCVCGGGRSECVLTGIADVMGTFIYLLCRLYLILRVKSRSTWARSLSLLFFKKHFCIKTWFRVQFKSPGNKWKSM